MTGRIPKKIFWVFDLFSLARQSRSYDTLRTVFGAVRILLFSPDSREISHVFFSYMRKYALKVKVFLKNCGLLKELANRIFLFIPRTQQFWGKGEDPAGLSQSTIQSSILAPSAILYHPNPRKV